MIKIKLNFCPKDKMINRLKNILLISVLISSCNTVKNFQQNKPFVFSSTAKNIEIEGGNFSKDEKNSLKQKMAGQLNDSSKVVVKDVLFIFHRIKYAPAYDSAYAAISAKNLRNTLLHLGYYNAKDTFIADTSTGYHYKSRNWKPIIEKEKRVTVKYIITAGNPTLIDTFSYKIKKPELQQLAEASKEKALIKENEPVTKANVLGEINRLVELYRNHGYYKFTPEELRMRGDTTIEALTNVDDPFETLRLLAEAHEKRDKPTIKLAVALNPQVDTSRLVKYYINNIFIYPDYSSADAEGKAPPPIEDTLRDSAFVRYHTPIVKKRFLTSQMTFKKGDVYSQEKFNSTLGNFSRTGVWQNVNIVVEEEKTKDSTGKLNMHIQLSPAQKYGFESNIEASYSSGSTNNVNIANSGNLLGLSGNVSLQSRNAARQGIKITHALRAGIEMNLNARPGAPNFINSQETGYNLTFGIPKLIYPFNYFPSLNKLYSKQTFIAASISHSDRIGLFKLNSFGLGLGYEFNITPTKTITIKPINIEFSNLYDRSADFDTAIAKNPYLRYSFNTALVMGSTAAFSDIKNKVKSNKSIVRSLKLTFEESGALLYFAFPLEDVGALNKYLKKFVRLDFEWTKSWNKPRSAKIIHFFGGVGIPIGSKDSTLPFFKQYFGGGPNSMRAWPVRGIGPGSQSLLNFDKRTLNDRTGDIKLELNLEYRKQLAQIIPNTLALKWALFADIGNVWNWKNTRPDQMFDSTQFPLSSLTNFYKQIGVNLGTGFRLDFNYVVLRLDFGFRFKRPELSENDGWKIPSIGFNDLLPKLFGRGKDEEYRKWRYENFNFTISLNYPF
ncbi:MAG: BamA/TamA family outer membrane protein [Bacteroidota bacterium]